MGGFANVRLNRPQVIDAFDAAMFQDLAVNLENTVTCAAHQRCRENRRSGAWNSSSRRGRRR
jgi:hypothetical protein